MICLKRSAFFLAATIILGGCASSNMVSTQIDPATGKVTQTEYSNLFLGQAEIVPGRIELALLAELVNKDGSPLHSLKQSMGALGADDVSSKVQVLAIFHNQTDQPLELELTKIDGPWQQHLVNQPTPLVLPPGATVKHLLGSLILGTYMTRAEFDIEFQHIDKTGKGQLTLERKNREEARTLQAQLTEG
jgi:hypothetical protein